MKAVTKARFVCENQYIAARNAGRKAVSSHTDAAPRSRLRHTHVVYRHQQQIAASPLPPEPLVADLKTNLRTLISLIYSFAGRAITASTGR